MAGESVLVLKYNKSRKKALAWKTTFWYLEFQEHDKSEVPEEAETSDKVDQSQVYCTCQVAEIAFKLDTPFSETRVFCTCFWESCTVSRQVWSFS